MAGVQIGRKPDPNAPTSLLYLLCKDVLGKGTKKAVPEGRSN